MVLLAEQEGPEAAEEQEVQEVPRVLGAMEAQEELPLAREQAEPEALSMPAVLLARTVAQVSQDSFNTPGQ